MARNRLTIGSYCCARFAVVVLFMLGTAACTDSLVFSEYSGFNLGISVNDEPSTPLQVNAGLERTVLAFAPPVGDADTAGNVRGDAVSLFSGFRLDDDHAAPNSSAFGGTLRIRSQFASGMAARNIAQNPSAAAKVVGVKLTFGPDDNSALLRKFIENPDNRAKLRQWMADNGVRTNTEFFLKGSQYKDKRKKAVDDLMK